MQKNMLQCICIAFFDKKMHKYSAARMDSAIRNVAKIHIKAIRAVAFRDRGESFPC